MLYVALFMNYKCVIIELNNKPNICENMKVFKFISMNGDLILLEINGRLWGSYVLSSHSKLCFSDNLLSLFTGKETHNKTTRLIPQEVIVTNELLLIKRWIAILRGPNKYVSSKFPSRFSILGELRYLFFYKKEVFMLNDFNVFFRFLWRR